MSDRTVHGRGNDGNVYEVVRYDRAGKWYIEYLDSARGLPCRRVSLSEAVNLADLAYLGLPGGRAFDRKWRAH